MSMEEKVLDALYDVIDPELGINIVDLGLVYGVGVDEENNVMVTMTLTTPGCPLHDSITGGVENRIKQIEHVQEVNVDIVWEPAWDPTKMSERARKALWS